MDAIEAAYRNGFDAAAEVHVDALVILRDRVKKLEIALVQTEEALTDEMDIQDNAGVVAAMKIIEGALVDPNEAPYIPCHLTEIG
jgi:hypothetical protein